uniref:Uncharacterized protein n=1 Tax=Oryza meridionalis TaxID=40149 RepID=A0A0E0FAT8_9ORYZ
MESGRIEGGARRQRRDEGSDEDCREPVPLTALAGQRTYGAAADREGSPDRHGGTVSGVSTCGNEIGERRRREWGCGARLRERSGDTQDRLQREAALLKTVVTDFYNTRFG